MAWALQTDHQGLSVIIDTFDSEQLQESKVFKAIQGLYAQWMQWQLRVSKNRKRLLQHHTLVSTTRAKCSRPRVAWAQATSAMSAISAMSKLKSDRNCFLTRRCNLSHTALQECKTFMSNWSLKLTAWKKTSPKQVHLIVSCWLRIWRFLRLLPTPTNTTRWLSSIATSQWSSRPKVGPSHSFNLQSMGAKTLGRVWKTNIWFTFVVFFVVLCALEVSKHSKVSVNVEWACKVDKQKPLHGSQWSRPQWPFPKWLHFLSFQNRNCFSCDNSYEAPTVQSLLTTLKPQIHRQIAELRLSQILCCPSVCF